MTRITHQEFRERLDDLASDPAAVPHSVQDSGTLAPTSRIPIEQIPGSRRPTRSRPPIPDPLGVIGSYIDGICYLYEVAPQTYTNFIRRTPAGAIAEAAWPNSVHNTLQRVCSQDPNWTPPLPAPRFTGGQCECSRYDVTVMFTFFASNGQSFNQTSGARVYGEILDVGAKAQPRPDGANDFFLVATCRGNVSSQSCQTGFVDVVISFAGTDLNSGQAPQISSISVVPFGGDPDSCGSPPPIYVDDGSITPAPNIDIDIAPGVNIGGIPIVVADVDGTLNIDLPDIGDVTIDVGGIDISFNREDGSDPPSEQPNPRPIPDDTGTDPSDPIPDPPSDDPPTEEPEEQPEEVIRAVLVTVTQPDSTSSIITQEDTPDVYVPDLGLISFRCRVSDSASGWTPDIRVKNLRCFIPCPYDGGAFEVKGTPRIGVEWTLTPVFDLSSIPSSP